MPKQTRNVKFTATNYAFARLARATGLTHPKLSEQLGTNETFVWYIVNGKRGLSADSVRDVAVKFARILNRPVVDVALELLGINKDGTLTEGQPLEPHTKAKRAAREPVEKEEAVTPRKAAKVNKAAKPKEAAKAKEKKPAKKAAVDPKELANARTKLAEVKKPVAKKAKPAAPAGPTLADLTAQAEAAGLTVYVFPGTGVNKGKEFAIACANKNQLAKLTGLGKSTIYSPKLAENPSVEVMALALAKPGTILSRKAGEGAFTPAV